MSKVIGQYTILEKIGEGGMGVIYKAQHSTLEQTVAIKALPRTLSSSDELRERFLREAKIQAKLSHPNVVNILNFFEFDGDHYIVMEYVEGETLEAFIKSRGLIPPDACMNMFRQVLAGVAYAHLQGIIHRDIKPSNIIIKKDGTVKITDFGIAKFAGDVQKTQTGVKVGTLWYMPPEQVRGEPAGVRSDIYALGVTLFEMITGKVPFCGDSEYSIMKNIVESPAPSPRDIYPYVPLPLENAIAKALAKDPAERFETVAEFEAALTAPEEPLVDAAPTQCLAAQHQDVAQAPRPTARWRRPALVGGGILLAALLSLSLLLIPRRSPPPLQPPVRSAVEAPLPLEVKTPPMKEVPRELEGVLKSARQSLEDHRYEGARAAYRKALDLDRENKEARQGLQSVARLLEEQNKREAVAELLGGARSAHGRGRYAKAIGLYQKVLTLSAGNKEAIKGIRDARTARSAEQGLGLQ